MFTASLIASAFEDLKNISGADYYLFDNSQRCIISTGDRITVKTDSIKVFLESEGEHLELAGLHLFKVIIGGEDKYVLVVNGKGSDGYMLGRIALSELMHFSNMSLGKINYNEFYRNLIFGNMISSDIVELASKLKISPSLKRVVYCIEVDADSVEGASELLSNIYSDKKTDIVILTGEGNLAMVHDVADQENLEETAYQIVSMINTELMIPARVTYGKEKTELSLLNESYRESMTAMEVSKIFFEERLVASYSSLGIGRIIHELPVSLCESFLEEVFGNSRNISLTEEEQKIVESFFDNSLSIADTSREMYIHRSTLVYRLDKIQKKTGLNIRVFDDAITLKIAVMVAKYLNRGETH